MVQKTAPNLGMAYGWDLGESGWKPGMDANMKKTGCDCGCRSAGHRQYAVSHG